MEELREYCRMMFPHTCEGIDDSVLWLILERHGGDVSLAKSDLDETFDLLERMQAASDMTRDDAY